MKRLLGILKYTAIVVFVLFLAMAIFLRLRYGGGAYYEDLSTAPLFPETRLEVVVEIDEPLGNLAVSKDHRVFYSIHPESRPEKNKVYESKNGKISLYPSAEFQEKFNTVLGLRIDKQGRLWTLDHGQHGFQSTKLMAFDLESNEMVHEYVFPSDIAQWGSFFNDFTVSPDGKTIYIADVSFFRKNPAIVIYDLETGKSRRVLEGHESVYPQDWIVRNPMKEMTFFGGILALKPGIDGITIDHKGEYVYYAAMTHEGLYKIKTKDLKNEDLTAKDLSDKVIRVGKKPLSDGISIDKEDNVYITDVEHGGIIRANPQGDLTTLIKTDKVRWADGLSFGGEGDWLYFTDSAIPAQMLQSKSYIKSQAPYFIYRLKNDIKGVAGQ